MIKLNFKNLIYVFMFVFIFCTDSFIVFANSNTIVKTLFQGLLGITAIYLAIRTKRYSRNSLYFLLLTLVCIMCTTVFTHDFSKGNLIKMILLTIGMIVVNGIDFESFRKTYVDVITVICTFSLVTFVLSFVIHNYGPLPIIENTSHVRVVFAGLSNISLSYGIPRNYGPFWEPGVYSIYLALGVLFELMNVNNITKRVILLFIGIITTLSTSGYVMIVILIAYFMFGDSGRFNSVGRKWVRYLSAASLLITFIILLTLNDDLSGAVFSKFNPGNYAYVSTAARISSIFGNIHIWKNNPIFGVGPTRLQEYYNNYLFSRGYLDNSNTNGLLIIFSMYGTVLGLCNIYGLSKFVSSLDKSIAGKTIIFGLLICMLFAEPLTTSCLFNILIFYGLHGDPIYESKYETFIT